MYKRILVAVDGSSTADKALGEAVLLVNALGADLCIAYAVDEAHLVQHGMGLGSYIDVEKVKGEMRDAGKLLLDSALAKAVAAGCRAEHMLIESSRKRVAEMIADAARDWRADLVILGTHGRRGFEQMLVGSVADNLTRIATTSLMLVRET